MGVPLLDLGRQHAEIEEECKKAFDRVFKANAFVLGREVQAFEEEVARYCHSQYAIGLSSGTDALLVALMALGIGPGDEVLCPSFTFFGTAGSIVRTGAKPVWVDVLPDTYNINLADALDKVTANTKAIMPVHLFGQPAEMDCVKAFATRYNLKIIEDVAQSIGASYNNCPAGSFGDFGALSFYPTKNLGGFGDGGMLVTDDPELAEKAIWLRNHGMNPKYYHKYVGGNFRLDALQAALLNVKLPHLDTYHRKRQKHAQFYNEMFTGHSGIKCPRIIDSASSVWNQYTIRVLHGKRDAFREFMSARGIGTEIYYPLGLHQQECFKDLYQDVPSLPITEKLCNEVVSIPVFPEMTEDERETVLKAVWDFGYAS